MVYGVFRRTDYYDKEVVGYFNSQVEADKYRCVYGGWNSYVEEIKDLTNEKDLSKIKIKYTHTITFHYDMSSHQWIMCEEPIIPYKCYIDNEFHNNSIDYNSHWIHFTINTDSENRELAEKIAQAYMDEILSYGEGELYKSNVDLMSNNFKERALREEELAELARLKEKYEKE